MTVTVTLGDAIETGEVVDLYRANNWSAADKPAQLLAALRESHSLVTARADGRLVGLGNAISDGHLVVYYPHLLVHPEFQNSGVGRKLMCVLSKQYEGFHQQMLTADGDAVAFYERLGFERAGQTTPMWIYAGDEH